MFDKFDVDGDGLLSASEVARLFSTFGREAPFTTDHEFVLMCTNKDLEMDAAGLGLTLRGLGQYYLSEGVSVLADDLRALGLRLGPLQLPIRAVEYAKRAAQRSNGRTKKIEADLESVSRELGRQQ